ncbi:putative Mu-like phage protein [Campylobacter blaseri]|uniref:Phage tail assembly protein n=1 Tax=Campylobacter blaseri TaxID=2042961 RepID=A0A2P8QYQ2_9BACT|nr:phage tail assembly protein [Campylobacter blaseri]PSM51371.1 hypothetical protein CQ405_08250 [Campylobacter blaseri]PSM52821.1 hypothetical protein CRN67_08255 [Campylobacter blaseri]QKF86122.1 putative Mu-like phage protein [Campylobacter blaseri]
MKSIKIELSDRTVEMFEPTVRVLKNANLKDGEVAQAVAMIAATTNMKENEIEDMGLKDYMALQKGLNSFLEVAGVTA